MTNRDAQSAMPKWKRLLLATAAQLSPAGRRSLARALEALRPVKPPDVMPSADRSAERDGERVP